MSDLIIIGGSGHAEVLADIALKNGYTIAGFLDDNEKTTEVLGFKVLGKVSDCLKYKNDCKFVIGIGNNAIRQRIAEEYDCQCIHSDFCNRNVLGVGYIALYV